ncbi:hypothetical protein TNCV_4409911 [Trichonephila clavipes]|nr:hypothetical protein TNCV_4409911 [Trichonephila clavipes]
MAKSRSGGHRSADLLEIVIPFVPQLMRMMKHLSSILVNPLVPKVGIKPYKFGNFLQKDCFETSKDNRIVSWTTLISFLP